MATTPTHVIGIDDAPFARTHRGNVSMVAAAYAGTRLEGVLLGKVRRDGANATDKIIDLIAGSRFAAHTQLLMLQGIALAGFNVVDIHTLNAALNMPVLVIARKPPDMAKIKRALLRAVPGGQRKWRLIEQAGPMEKVAKVYVQRAGIDVKTTQRVITRFATNSVIPEPLRTAHLIATALGGGTSRQRV